MTDNPGEMNFRYNVDQASIKNAIDAVNSINKSIDDGTVDMRGWSQQAAKAAEVIETYTRGSAATADSVKNIASAFHGWKIELDQLPAELTGVANALTMLYTNMNLVAAAAAEVKKEDFIGQDSLNALRSATLELDGQTQSVKQNTQAKKEATKAQVDLDAELERQFAIDEQLQSQQGAGLEPYNPLHPSGVAIPNAADIPPDLAEKYGLKREAEFNAPPSGMQGASDVLSQSRNISGAYEALQQLQNQLKLANDALLRMGTNLEDLDPSFQRLANKVLEFGDSGQKLGDVAKTIDDIRTSTGKLEGDGTLSLERVAIAVQDFEEKFRLLHVPARSDDLGVSGFDAGNLIANQIKLPIGGATIPGAPEGVGPADFTSVTSRGYIEAENAVKEFNASLAEGVVEQNAQKDIINDLIKTFSSLKSEMSDGSETLDQLYNALDKVQEAEEKLSGFHDLSDTFKDLEDSLSKGTTTTEELDVALVQLGEAKDRLKDFRDIAGIFVELNQKLEDGTARVSDMSDAVDRLSGFELELSDTPDYYQKLLTSLSLYVAEKQKVADMLVPQGGAGGAGGELPTGENNGLPFAGAGEVGGLSDEVDKIKQAWMEITEREYNAIQTMDGITTKADEAAGTFAILVEESDQYNAALEKMDEALMGGVDAWSTQEKAAAAAQAELQAIQEEAAGPAREAGLAFRDALGPIQTQIDLIKGLKSDYILLNDEAADYEEKLRAAEALHREIQAVMISEGETHRGLIQISVSSEEEYQKELKAIQDEVAAWTAAAEAASRVPSSAGGAGGGKPPEPPKPPEPDYTIPPEYGGAPFDKQSGVIRPNLGFGEDEIQARQAKEAVDEIIKSYKDLNREKQGVNQNEESFTRMLADSNVQFASLLNKAQEFGKAADIEEIIVQFAALTTNEEQAVRNATALEQTLKGLGTGHIAEAVGLFNQLIDKEQQLISVQDQLNTKPLNLTVAGSGSNIPGAPDSAKATDNTYNIAFDESAKSAAELQAELAAITGDLSVINPAADKTSFAFQNIAAANQEIRQVAAVDDLAKKFYALSDSIGSDQDALDNMLSSLRSIGASPEQIDQATAAFKKLQTQAQAAADAEQAAADRVKQGVIGYGVEGGLQGPALPGEDEGPNGNLGQRAVPAEGLRRTGTAISQLGMGNKDIQQIGMDIRLIGDVQQVNKEIGLLAGAFKELPGTLGDVGRAAGEMATQFAGPVAGSIATTLVVVAPFVAGATIVAIGLNKITDELKGVNDQLVAAESGLKTYYDAIQSGTEDSISKQLATLQSQKDSIDSQNRQNAISLGGGYASAQSELGALGPAILSAVLATGLLLPEAKNLNDSFAKSAAESNKLTGEINSLQNAQKDAGVVANSTAEGVISRANDLAAIRKQEASDTIMTSDSIKKRLDDLRSERGLLEEVKSTDEEALAVKGITRDEALKLNADISKTNDLLNKNADEQKFVADTAIPLIKAREDEAAAIKAEDDAIKKFVQTRIQEADAAGKYAEQKSKDLRGDNALGTKGEIQGFKDDVTGINATISSLRDAQLHAGSDSEIKAYQDAIDSLNKQLDLARGKIKDYTDSVLPTVQAHERLKDITLELTSETDAYSKKESDILAIRQQDSERMLTIEQDYSNKLINIAQKARDAAVQALTELKSKQEQDLQKLSDGTTDDQTKLAITKRDAQIKFGEQEVKDWTDHYNKLADLRQKAQDSEYDDEANRDFAALARDRRKLSTDINSENTNYTQKETQKQTQLADELKMDDLHAKDQAAQRLVEYERANRDAQQQYDQRLQAAKDAAQKEKDAADAARAQEIAAEVAHFNNLMSVREEKYQEELNLLRKHLQDEIDVINGTSVNTQGGNGYSYGPQNQGATQPYSNPNPGLQVYSPSMYQGGGTSTQLNTTVTGNTIALPNLQDLIGGVENAGLSLLQSFLSS